MKLRHEGAGLLGKRIYVERGSWKRVHLADNLADAVLVGPTARGRGGVSQAELLRVLRPGGKALLGDGKVLMNFRETTVVPLKRLTPYLINCGAVGQPRDRCPMAAAGIFDAARWELTIVRVPYPIEAVQAKNRAAEIPERFSLRLEAGT